MATRAAKPTRLDRNVLHPPHSTRRAIAAAGDYEPPYDADGELDKAVSIITRHGHNAFSETMTAYRLHEIGLSLQLCQRLSEALHEVSRTLQSELF